MTCVNTYHVHIYIDMDAADTLHVHSHSRVNMYLFSPLMFPQLLPTCKMWPLSGWQVGSLSRVSLQCQTRTYCVEWPLALERRLLILSRQIWWRAPVLQLRLWWCPTFHKKCWSILLKQWMWVMEWPLRTSGWLEWYLCFRMKETQVCTYVRVCCVCLFACVCLCVCMR